MVNFVFDSEISHTTTPKKKIRDMYGKMYNQDSFESEQNNFKHSELAVYKSKYFKFIKIAGATPRVPFYLEWPRFLCSLCRTIEHSKLSISWWRHQMETFSALLAICAGNSPGFPTQRPVTRSIDVFFGLRLNKRLSKQSWGWWLETLSRPFWRNRNVNDLTRWNDSHYMNMSFK